VVQLGPSNTAYKTMKRMGVLFQRHRGHSRKRAHQRAFLSKKDRFHRRTMRYNLRYHPVQGVCSKSNPAARICRRASARSSGSAAWTRPWKPKVVRVQRPENGAVVFDRAHRAVTAPGRQRSELSGIHGGEYQQLSRTQSRRSAISLCVRYVRTTVLKRANPGQH